MPRLAALALAAAAACGTGVDPPPSDTTTSSDTTAGHSETGPAPTTSTPPIVGTTTGIASTTSSDGSTFITYDVSTVVECDPWQPDCPPGQKCAWYANDGGASWNDTKCVPIMEDPAQLNEPCFVLGNGVSGIDNCDIGLICWDVDPDDQGHCAAHCSGPVEDPSCPEGLACNIFSYGFSLCYEVCDPVLQDCTKTDDNCVNYSAPDFFCEPTTGAGEPLHATCHALFSCDKGLYCVPSSSAVECDQGESQFCCEPFCDLSLPNTCPGQGQECTPFLPPADAPAAYAHVGLCYLP